jgi:competence protein ComEC
VHFREIPFLRLFTPLAAGVLVAETAPSADTAAWIILAIAGAAMTIRLRVQGYRSDIFFGSALMLFLVAAGYLLNITGKSRLSALADRSDIFTVRLSEYPEKRTSSYAFRAMIISSGDDSHQSFPHGSLLLYYISDSLPSLWLPGDILQIRTTPHPIENNGNPCEFDYRRYLAGQGVRYMGFIRVEDILGCRSPEHRRLKEISLILARKMINTFEAAGLQGEDLGLVTALTIGDKDLLDSDRLTSFSRAGAMHIMAVSGMHVGMISLGLSYLLFFMRRRMKVLKVVIITASLWGFAFLTGMSPSVLRATIMFTFLQAGSLIGRPAASMNSLLASAFILTAARPAVLFEAGFQLSYLAVTFIIAFYEPLYRIIKIRSRLLDYVWQMTAVSLVAQAGTLALSVRLFNIFPLLFLVTNIVVIPVTFGVLVLSFFLILFSSLTPVAAFTALLLRLLLQSTLRFTGMISSLDHGVIENIGLTPSETLLLIVALALLLTSLLRVAKITLKPFLVAATIFLGCGLFKDLKESREEKTVVYNIRGRELKAMQHGKRLIVPSTDGGVPPEVKKHAAERRLKIEIFQPG